MINDIRNYFNRLVKNTKNDNIKFFSNIELGTKSKNPHLHIQVWHDNQKQIDKIYNKVIERFGLFSEFCKLTLEDGPSGPKKIGTCLDRPKNDGPNELDHMKVNSLGYPHKLILHRLDHNNKSTTDHIHNLDIGELDHKKQSVTDHRYYSYVIKDYRKDMSDEELLNLDDSKRVFRGVLDKKIRFSSHSKGKYTKAVYKSLYSKFDLKKDTVDLLLDNCVIDIRGNVDSRVIEFFVMLILRQYIINRCECVKCEIELYEYMKMFSFSWWIFGKT